MIIQELKPSKRVEGRWLAVLEDGSILRLGESEVVDFALYAGKELTGGEADRLQNAIHRGAVKTKAIEILMRKPQSRRELERKLGEWGAAEDESAAVCDRMEELGYLNDGAYAAQVVRHYAARGFGEKKLRDELYRRGVPRELWEEALEQAEDPADAIDALIAKKLAGRIPDRREMKKVSDALMRRGYRWSEISEGLRRYGAELEPD